MPQVELKVTPQQAEIINDPARIKILAIGRRWGKTTLLLLALVKICLEKKGCKCLFVCQNYSNALAFQRAMWNTGALREVVAHNYAAYPPRFLFINGSILEFKSYDKPDSLWGAGYAGIGLDEACAAGKAVYEQTLLPMVSDTGGTIYLASNFQKGRDWFFDLAQTGKTEKAHKDGIKTWEYKTADGIRFQSERGKAELERLKRILPHNIFRCQFENEPIVGMNSVFRWRSEVNEKGERPAGPEPGKKYCQGLDVGRVQDPSFSVVIECPPPMARPNQLPAQQPGRIVYAERFPLGLAYRAQARRAIELAHFWNNAVTVGDDTGARGGAAPAKEPFWHLFEDEFRIAQPFVYLRAFHFNQYTKFTLVNFLAVEIEEGRVFCAPPDNCQMFSELVNQIKIFTFKVTNNFVKYGAPDGEHDDGVCALGLAVNGKSSGYANAAAPVGMTGFTR